MSFLFGKTLNSVVRLRVRIMNKIVKGAPGYQMSLSRNIILWEGTDECSLRLAPGIYIVQIIGEYDVVKQKILKSYK